MARQGFLVKPRNIIESLLDPRAAGRRGEEESRLASATLLKQLLPALQEQREVSPGVAPETIAGEQGFATGGIPPILEDLISTQQLADIQKTPGGLDIFKQLTGQALTPEKVTQPKNLVRAELADLLRSQGIDPTNPEQVTSNIVALAEERLEERKGRIAGLTGFAGAKARLAATGKPAETAGKQAGIKVAKENLKDLNKLFFPEGKLDRGLIAKMNVPGGGLPFSTGRDANLLISDTINSRIRLESGAAITEEELKRISKRFTPSVFDDARTVKLKMNLFNKFLDNANLLLDPSGLFNEGKFDANFPEPESLSAKPLNELSDEELDAEIERLRGALGGQ